MKQFRRWRAGLSPDPVTSLVAGAIWLLVATTLCYNLYVSYKGFLLERRLAIHDQTLSALSTTAAIADGNLQNLQVMLNVVREYPIRQGTDRHLDSAAHQYIRTLVEETPMVVDIVLLDGNGRPIHGEQAPTPADEALTAGLVNSTLGSQTGGGVTLAILDWPTPAGGEVRPQLGVALPLPEGGASEANLVVALVDLGVMESRLSTPLGNWGGRIFLYDAATRFLTTMPPDGTKGPPLTPLIGGLKEWYEGGRSLHWDFPPSMSGREIFRIIYRNGLDSPLLYVGEFPLRGELEDWVLETRWLIGLYLLLLLLGALVAFLMVGLMKRLRHTNSMLTRSVEAEKRASQSKEEALIARNAVLDNAVVTIILLVGNKFTWVNRQMRTLFGYSDAELIGKGVLLLFSDRMDYERVTRESAPTLSAGDSYVIEVQFRRKGGQPVWCVLSGKAIDPGDLQKGVIWIIVDISARKHYEMELDKAKRTAERASEAKTLFLTNMSHELRTPLNAILGYARILPRQPDKLIEGASAIENAGTHLLDLINDLLDMARIEAGRLSLEPVAFSLPVFLHELVGIIRVRAEERGLDFTAQIDATNLPVGVMADQKRLRQILLNLLGNAVKFTESGGVTLIVRLLEGSDADPLRVEFAVEDSGIGISARQREQIFRLFEQGSAPNGSVEPGSGLGLAITRRLVRLMGGEIQLQSTPGEGSRFSFQLELARAELSSERGEAPRGRYLGRQRRILVVDDVANNRQVLQQYLEMAGFRVDAVEDAGQALTVARATPPDAVLMDLRMPGLDGFEATVLLVEEANLGEVPVIAVSASIAELGRAEHLHLFRAFLHKPVDEQELLKRLGELLQLEWQPGGESEGVPSLPATALPGVGDLQELQRLVKLGRTSKIREWITRMEARESASSPFLQSLRERLAEFDLEALEAALQQHLDASRDA